MGLQNLRRAAEGHICAVGNIRKDDQVFSGRYDVFYSLDRNDHTAGTADQQFNSTVQMGREMELIWKCSKKDIVDQYLRSSSRRRVNLTHSHVILPSEYPPTPESDKYVVGIIPYFPDSHKRHFVHLSHRSL